MKKLKVIIFTVLLCLSMQSFGLFLFNESHNAYEDKENIENLIVNGAGYFLASHSNFLCLLQKIELSNNCLEYDDLNQVLKMVVENLERASAIYYDLYNTVKTKSYNQAVLERLINFDYLSYQQKSNAIPLIYSRVQAYLGEGNVNGLYSEIFSKTREILSALYEVKNNIDEHKTPNTTTLWGINEAYMRSLLFGQYTAEIFSNL